MATETTRKKGRKMSDAELTAKSTRELFGMLKQFMRSDFGGASDQTEWGRKRVATRIKDKFDRKLPDAVVTELAEMLVEEKKETAAGIRNRTRRVVDELSNRLPDSDLGTIDLE